MCVYVCACVCVFCVFVQVCAFVVVTAVVVVVCVCACVSFVRARLVRYVVGLVVCFPLCLASSPFFLRVVLERPVLCCLTWVRLFYEFLLDFSAVLLHICAPGDHFWANFLAKLVDGAPRDPKGPHGGGIFFRARGKKHFFNAFFGG